MSDEKPSTDEIHRAVELAKTCPPGINRTAAWAHELAEYRSALALDPAFVLAAAERLLREAASGTLRIELDDACGRAVGARLDCFWTGRVYADSRGDPAKALYEAYAKLLAARKGHG
jgi:hypothetical protein